MDYPEDKSEDFNPGCLKVRREEKSRFIKSKINWSRYLLIRFYINLYTDRITKTVNDAS